MAKKPQRVGPSFGGKNFFPTHAPRAIIAMCRKENFFGDIDLRRGKLARKLKFTAKHESMPSGHLKKGVSLGLYFFTRPRVAHVHVDQVPVTLPVFIHRGTHVNTRHNRDYIAPKKARVANGEWNGGAA